jgi:DNA-binding SARP family transcriptional activator
MRREPAMATALLTLLGGFEAAMCDTRVPIHLPSKKAAAMLAYVVSSPQLHRRDSLAALLWGDVPREQGRHSLRQTLVGLKRAFANCTPHPFVMTNDAIAISAGWIEVDVLRFEALVTERTPAAIAEAARLYRGELLHGLHVNEAAFEDWLMAERARLRHLAVRTLELRLAELSRLRSLDDAIQIAIRLLALDPLHEDVHRQLMKLYRQKGQMGAALQQYEICSRALRREVGVEPEAATRELYREMLTNRLRGDVRLNADGDLLRGDSPLPPPRTPPAGPAVVFGTPGERIAGTVERPRADDEPPWRFPKRN